MEEKHPPLDTGHVQSVLVQKEIAAGILHDANNQLTVLKGLLTVLRARAIQPEIISMMSDALEILIHQVSMLRTYGKRNAGYMRFDIHHLTRSTLDSYAQALGGKLSLRYYGNEEPVYVYGSEQALSSVLLNLAVNALDAMDGYGVLDVTEQLFNGYWQVSIRDYGCGMTLEQLARAFEREYTTKRTGSGLGLPVSRQTAEEHRGSLSVTSSPGKGTTVFLTLPVMEY